MCEQALYARSNKRCATCAVTATHRIYITRSAEADLAQIWDYIAADSPERAEQFVSRLEQELARLEAMPLRCAVIPEAEMLGVEYRHLLVGDYRIIFRADATEVLIIRVVHGTRLLELDP